MSRSTQENILPLKIFRRLFPEKLTAEGYPSHGSAANQSNTTLSAYNSSRIRQYGSITLPCRYSCSKWGYAEFFLTETNGPAILGLPGSRQLKLVTLHCAIDKGMCSPHETGDHSPVKSVEDLMQLCADRFDSLGHFPGIYHIVIDLNVQPTIHAPRKCPIQIKDEIKSELQKMEEARVIKRVTEPTDWVSSLTFSRKRDGGLRMCLDPKDLNRAIKRCHHKTPTLEETLDNESSLLTTFNSSFGRYCFLRSASSAPSTMRKECTQTRIRLRTFR